MSEACFCFAAPVDSCPQHGTREDETPRGMRINIVDILQDPAMEGPTRELLEDSMVSLTPENVDNEEWIKEIRKRMGLDP